MSEPTSDAVQCVARAAALDRAVVARVLDGDEKAFLALVERHHASVLRLAEAFGHGDRSADDAARTCWSAVLEALGAFRFTVPLRTWILGIAASAMRPSAADLDPRRGEAGSESEAFDSAGRWVEPPAHWDEALVATRVTAAMLDAAISHLPWRERAAVTLRDVEGLSADDTSWILGVGAPELASVLGRAREQLRRELDARVRAVRTGRSSGPAPTAGLSSRAAC